MPRRSDIFRLLLLSVMLTALPWAARASRQFPDSTLRSDRWLEQSVVTASAPLVRVVSDTVSYQLSSVLVDEDAGADALLQAVPGVEISSDGTITIRGKAVKQLMVGGKRYFAGDIRSCLKNIPAEMVERISSYDRPSDLSRLSGVDDAAEELVLDITVKEKYARGWHNNLTVGGGVPSKYGARFNGNHLAAGEKASVVAGIDNVSPVQNSTKTSVRMGTGNAGNTVKGEAGLNYATEKERLGFTGSLQYNHTGKDASYGQFNEFFRANGYHHTEVEGTEKASRNNVTAQGLLEWKAGARTYVVIKPQLKLVRNAGDGFVDTRSFRTSQNPTYRSERASDSDDRSLDAGSSFQVTRRFGKSGRTFSSYTNLGFKAADEDLLSNTTMHYYNASRRDTLQQRDRSSDTRTDEYSLVQQFLWNEPVSDGHFIQLSYRQTLRRTLSDRQNRILDGGKDEPDTEHSASGVYDYIAGNLALNYRYKRPLFNLTAGVSLSPMRTLLRFPESASFSDTTTNSLRLAPNITLNYARRKGSKLQLTYKSFATTPRMSYLLPVASNTNPLYIQMPNTGLRPSFTHDVLLNWMISDKYSRRSLSVTGTWRAVQDDFSTSTSYNSSSGGRIVTPVNIDGNWQAGAEVVMHAAFRNLLASSQTSASWNNDNAYLYNNSTREDELNLTRRAFLRETMVLTLRKTRYEASLAAGGQIVSEKSLLRPEMDRAPWSIWGGASFIWKIPFGLTASSDFKALLQRAMAFEQLNRCYYVWNAKLTQTLLKDKLLLQAEATDILGQLENVVTDFSAEKRGISLYNGASRCLLMRIIWKFDTGVR